MKVSELKRQLHAVNHQLTIRHYHRGYESYSGSTISRSHNGVISISSENTPGNCMTAGVLLNWITLNAKDLDSVWCVSIKGYDECVSTIEPEGQHLNIHTW